MTTAAPVVPPCPIADCVVYLDMTVLPNDPIVGSPLSSKRRRSDWTGELVLQPCGHALTAEQQETWLSAYRPDR